MQQPSLQPSLGKAKPSLPKAISRAGHDHLTTVIGVLLSVEGLALGFSDVFGVQGFLNPKPKTLNLIPEP